jgi:GNAT superfamily N-acetyltransferase
VDKYVDSWEIRCSEREYTLRRIMPTLGAQVVPSRILELRRLLQDLTADDLSVLDPSLGDWMKRPLGREAMASVVLPSAGSTYLCLLNFEPASLIVIERGQAAARIRALTVAPDMRRRGLARTMLEAADELTQDAGLDWLWMSVPSANVPATACALACGYKRYRPQFMRRQRTGILSLKLERARVEPLDGDDARIQLEQWIALTAEQGDAWCHPLASADLLAWNMPDLTLGKTYALISGADEVGMAHVMGERAHPRVTLWLERELWATPRELNVFKAVMDTLTDAPPAIDIEFGSGDHLRASVQLYKPLHFKPMVREDVVMVRSAQV